MCGDGGGAFEIYMWLILHTNWKSYIVRLSAPLYLILSDLKGQGGHSRSLRFERLYLVKDPGKSTNNYYLQHFDLVYKDIPFGKKHPSIAKLRSQENNWNSGINCESKDCSCV